MTDLSDALLFPVPCLVASMLLAVLALLLDGLGGEPDILWRRLPHPVVWLGRLLSWLEGLLYPADGSAEPRLARRGLLIRGSVCLGLFVLIAGLAGFGLSWLLWHVLPGWAAFLLEAALISIFLAQKSLVQHVRAVPDAMEAQDSPEESLAAGRKAVSMIVGRDPESLDTAGVCRAAIESAAENFSDGVIAPLFWAVLFGLPGILLYKAMNTADSMIGHRNARYEAFGKAAARLDDLVNLVPARLSGLLLLLAGAGRRGSQDRSPRSGWLRILFRDARKHRSPNAGWPETAMALGLGLALAGPRQYGRERIKAPWLNEAGNRCPGPEHVRQAAALLWKAWGLALIALAGLALGLAVLAAGVVLGPL